MHPVIQKCTRLSGKCTLKNGKCTLFFFRVHAFLHAEADAGAVAAAVTGRFLLRRLGQVVTVLLLERAPCFSVLPEEAASAAFGAVSVVTHAVNYDRFFFHRIILLFHDGSAEPAEMKKARLPFRTATGLCMEAFLLGRQRRPAGRTFC